MVRGLPFPYSKLCSSGAFAETVLSIVWLCLNLAHIYFPQKRYVIRKGKLLWYGKRERGTVHQELGEIGLDTAVRTLLTIIYKTIELIELIVWVVARLIGDIDYLHTLCLGCLTGPRIIYLRTCLIINFHLFSITPFSAFSISCCESIASRNRNKAFNIVGRCGLFEIFKC